MPSEIICKLTGEIGTPVRAHIIPRAFYSFDESGEPSLVLSSKKGHRPTRSPIGVYDSSILTESGEKILQNYDDYGFRFFNEIVQESENILYGSEIVGKSVKNFDYKKLKLFCLSVLWRASVSERSEFKAVNLGPHEYTLKSMIISECPGNCYQYSIILSMFKESFVDVPLLFPHKFRDNGVLYYRVILKNFAILVKVDKQKPLGAFDRLTIREGSPALVIMRDLVGSPEFKAVSQMVTSTKGMVPDWFKKAGKRAARRS